MIIHVVNNFLGYIYTGQYFSSDCIHFDIIPISMRESIRVVKHLKKKRTRLFWLLIFYWLFNWFFWFFPWFFWFFPWFFQQSLRLQFSVKNHFHSLSCVDVSGILNPLLTDFLLTMFSKTTMTLNVKKNKQVFTLLLFPFQFALINIHLLPFFCKGRRFEGWS